MAKKVKKTIIGLKCSETGKVNYHVYKPGNMKEKLKVKKFSPELGKHTLHEEVKLK